MSDASALRKALQKEINKLTRQLDAVDATRAMIALLENQIKTIEKTK